MVSKTYLSTCHVHHLIQPSEQLHWTRIFAFLICHEETEAQEVNILSEVIKLVGRRACYISSWQSKKIKNSKSLVSALTINFRLTTD